MAWRIAPRAKLSWNPALAYGFQHLLVPNPNGRGYNFATQNEAVNEVRDWCRDQFGPNAPIDGAHQRWASMGSEIRFRDPVDATAFRLRWC